MAGSHRSGKGSAVLVGITQLQKNSFEVEHKGADLETTTFEDDGKETGLTGVEVCDYKIGGDWDAAADKVADPPGLYPRSDLDDVALYPNVDDATFWDFPISRVLSASNGSKVKELVTFSASLKSNGDFTGPGG